MMLSILVRDLHAILYTFNKALIVFLEELSHFGPPEKQTKKTLHKMISQTIILSKHKYIYSFLRGTNSPENSITRTTPFKKKTDSTGCCVIYLHSTNVFLDGGG